MIYCDTSLLVSLFTAESHSQVAQSWFLRTPHAELVVSDWSVVEVASALASKHRGRAIDDAGRFAAEAAWVVLQAEASFVSVLARHFTRAAALVDSAPRGLRAGDALHLAITLDQGCDLATFDRDMADAARGLGVAVHPA